jgi:branched-chain amino acid transport system ATP-binding protein
MTKVLEVREIAKSFGGVQAVNNLSFDLSAGRLLAMIGPNGAGKSTCFNLINGQLRPDRGSIAILGKKISGKRPRQVWKLGVGRTFQITATFSSMTVLENIKMAVLSYHRRTRSLCSRVRKLYGDESMELLKLVGIEDQYDRACGILAYGDLKRVELAAALANKPKLLLMDEPTAGMGRAERRSLMALVSNIVLNQNIGVLFTEHDMEAVFNHADHIIVLHHGELIAEGTPTEVRENERVQEVYLGKRAAESKK